MTGLDFETWGTVDLKEVGLDNYINHEDFQPTLASLYLRGVYTTLDLFEGAPNWLRNREQLLRLVEDRTLGAHNSEFEHQVLEWLLARTTPSLRERYCRPTLVDTAVLSRLSGGSSSLAKAAPQLIEGAKLDEDRKLLAKFAWGERPHAGWARDPDWQDYRDYCEQDAVLSSRLMRTIPHERHPFEKYTAQMNRTGWYVDMRAVDKMMEAVEVNTAKLLKEFQADWDPKGELNFASPVQLVRWCAERKVRASGFDELAVEKLLASFTKKYPNPMDAPENHQAVWDMLLTKQAIGGTSTKKLDVIKRLTSADGRLRHQYVHVGAGQTARTTGAGVQMQNLKRLRDVFSIEDMLDGKYDPSNEELGSNMRQLFMAEHPQGELIVGDLSSIESRGLAWQAGEQWKLDAYYDGKDIYKMQADKEFKVGYDNITKDQRTFGKVGELSCGYQSGPVAVRSFAEKMGVDLTPDAAASVVRGWRATNPNIVAYWGRLDDGIEEAMASGHAAVDIGPSGFGCRVHLWSTPALDSIQEIHPGAKDLQVQLIVPGQGSLMARYFRGMFRKGRNWVYHKPRTAKSGPLWASEYKDPKAKQGDKYIDHTLYGGKLSGILTQSLCRELFFDIVSQVANELTFPWYRNVKLVGQFHDEIVLEWTPMEGASKLEDAVKVLQETMAAERLSGFPMDAEVNHSRRYIK